MNTSILLKEKDDLLQRYPQSSTISSYLNEEGDKGTDQAYWPRSLFESPAREKNISTQDTDISEPNGTTETVGFIATPLQGKSILSRFPKRELPQEYLDIHQSWEGWVTLVGENYFKANVKDLTNTENPLEEVEMDIEEIFPTDKNLVEEGAVFYWYIGYRDSLKKGQRERFSIIRFRRLPGWSKADIDKAELFANELTEYFRKERNKTAQK